MKSPNSYYTEGVLISKDHDPVDCALVINDETGCAILIKKNGDYIAPRALSRDQYDRFKRHGLVGSDPNKFPDISFVKHGMNAETLIEHYNFNNFSQHGKISDQPMDSVDIAQKFGEIMQNRPVGSDTCYGNDF